jgi:hypothetical protein
MHDELAGFLGAGLIDQIYKDRPQEVDAYTAQFSGPVQSQAIQRFARNFQGDRFKAIDSAAGGDTRDAMIEFLFEHSKEMRIDDPQLKTYLPMIASQELARRLEQRLK